ncbi:hypothetical protein NA2_20587 [Nitratireductor pacificus pht-3B]|uniref:Uncharacterized protein n=1 Tax=Nitratireductor pacificus pht-3B TaxID=391937 RepID=K2LGN2_9HYPH|nr:hypothetical protein NA2_20587 [Nitratireductor pacificus pht-3B]
MNRVDVDRIPRPDAEIIAPCRQITDTLAVVDYHRTGAKGCIGELEDAYGLSFFRFKLRINRMHCAGAFKMHQRGLAMGMVSLDHHMRMLAPYAI